MTLFNRKSDSAFSKNRVIGIEDKVLEQSSTSSNKESDSALNKDRIIGIEDKILEQSSTSSNKELDMVLSRNRIGVEDEVLNRKLNKGLSNNKIIGVGKNYIIII